MSMNSAPDQLAYYSINRVENLEKENAILREALSEYLKSVEIARGALARRSKKET